MSKPLLGILDRNILAQIVLIYFAIVISIVSFLWLIQTVGSFGGFLSRGQNIWALIEVIGSKLPIFLLSVSPIAAFIAVVRVLLTMNENRETIINTIMGRSILSRLKPIIAFALITILIDASISFFIQPMGLYNFRVAWAKVNAQVILDVVKPRSFTEISENMVFYVHDNDASGAMRGVMLSRIYGKDNSLLMIRSDSARLVKDEENRFLIFENGSLTEKSGTTGEVLVAHFELYSLNFNQIVGDGSYFVATNRYDVKTLPQLLQSLYGQNDLSAKEVQNHIYEVTLRLCTPFLGVIFVLIASAFLGYPVSGRRTSRLNLLLSSSLIAGMSLVSALFTFNAQRDIEKAIQLALTYGLFFLSAIALIWFMHVGGTAWRKA